MPCHQTIEYDDPDWQASQYPDSSLCAGSLIHIRNQFKMPRDAGLAAGVRMVPMDPVNVFQWPQEFIDHHNSGEFKSWQKQERTGRPKTTRSA